MTEATLIALLESEVKGLSEYLDSEDYVNAVDAAERDTGWTMPVSGAFKEKWIIERAKRALFFYLQTESAHKFRVKEIHLHQRFDNYLKLIKLMDAQFDKAQEDSPEEFAEVSAYEMFGTKVDAGFQYEPQTGIETTYDDTVNRVLHDPNETS